MIIAISGTPGTGKSYVSKHLSGIFKVVDLNALIKKHKLHDGYDHVDKTFDVDVEKLSSFMDKQYSRYNYDKNDKSQKASYKTLSRMVNKSIPVQLFLSTIEHMEIKHQNKNNNILIDSHMSHYLNCDFCIIMRSEIKSLHKRLSKRKYDKKKLNDNIQSEIFGICLEEAKALNRKIIVVEN